MLVNEDFGADDAAKRLEHLNQVRILHIVREVVDEQVAALGACVVCVCVCVCACVSPVSSMPW